MCNSKKNRLIQCVQLVVEGDSVIHLLARNALCVRLDMTADPLRQGVSDGRIRRRALVRIDPQTNIIWVA